MADRLRPPPQAIPAEQAVIGACLLVPESFHRLGDLLDESDFYRRDHRLIFRSIKELAEAGQPYDAVTLGEWAESKGLAEEMGGPSYLINLASTTPSATNVLAYAEIVKDRSLLRQMIEAGTEIVNNGFQPEGMTGMEVFLKAQSKLAKAGPKSLSKVPSPKDILRRVVIFMRDRMHDDARLLGYATELAAVDARLNGLEDATLTVIAARPSMGKTALMLQFAIAGALRGERVFIASMEMSAVALMMRAIANHGRVNLRSIRSPKEAEDSDLIRVKEAAKALAETDLLIDDSPQNIDSLCARIRQLHMLKPLKAAFIDYLQHMEMPKADTHSLAVQIVTRRLKALAKELNIPIVLLSQLNRGLEARGDKRPMLSDLRESGAIEQDADNIVFIYRDEYYKPDSVFKGIAEIITAKARNEATGTDYARCHLEKQLFTDCPKDEVPNAEQQQSQRERPAVGTRRAGGQRSFPARGYSQPEPD